MIYIFGGGYKSLLFALYLKNLRKKITIVTYNKDTIKYCATENIDYIQFEKVRPKVTSIYELFTLKKILDGLIKKIDLGKEDCFILTGIALAYDSFYLAKELAKKGKVFYKIADRKFKKYKPQLHKPIFFRGAIFRPALKLILGIDIIYYEANKDPRLGIDENFLKKHDIEEYKPDIPTEEMIIEAIKKIKSNFREFDNLIIDDGGPLKNIIKFDSMMKLYDNLFKLPIGFAFKKHPSSKKHKGKAIMDFYDHFKHCEELPKYIPVELFCNNIKKNVLSIFSASLTTTSQFEHLNTISLLELVDWQNESYKKEFKDHLIMASKNKILFPKSFDELKEILLE